MISPLRVSWCDCPLPRSFVQYKQTGEYVHSDPKCLRPTYPNWLRLVRALHAPATPEERIKP